MRVCAATHGMYYGSFPDKHFTCSHFCNYTTIAFLLGSIRMKFDFKQIVRYVSYVHISTHMNVVWSSGSYDNIYMYRSMTAVHK